MAVTLKGPKFCSICNKHLLVCCLTGGQNKLERILVFLNCRHPVESESR